MTTAAHLQNRTRAPAVASAAARAVPSTRFVRAYSSPVRFELHFWARVLEKKICANDKQRKKLANLLLRRLKHHGTFNIALSGTMQIIQELSRLASILSGTRVTNYNELVITR